MGGIAAISGLIIYQIFLILHPHTPPYETEAAFADYAAEPYWVIIHLGEMLGILLIGAAALALSWRLCGGRAGVWATLGGAGVLVAVTAYGVYIAVDGVALKIMVDRWAAAGPDTQELLFETAFAVRQIEAGLVAVVWLMFGITGLLYGGAFFASAATSFRLGWLSGLGWLSVAAGIGAVGTGLVQAHTGFSDISMTVAGIGTPLFALWVLAVGVFLFRCPEHVAGLDQGGRGRQRAET
jgi:hypothetical protein